MKLFIKILLFVLIALVANVNVTSASITFSNIQEKANSNLFHAQIAKTEFKFSENDLANCCQNQQDLVDYRNRGEGVEVIAAKTSTSLVTKYPAVAKVAGTAERTFLMPGQVIDRYGAMGGKWFSTPGTSYGARSIPSGLSPHTQFKVLKPFEVQKSLASPGMFSGQREKRVRIIKQDEKVDRVFDRNSPKGREIEKGSFDLEKYRAEGYKIETVVPAGMGATDLGLSIFGGEMAAVKIGSWIGKGVSAWKASRAAKAVAATAEVGTNVAKTSTTGFRYMSQAELKAIQETGYLRGGWSGETYFTKDLYKSAAKAQSRLSLGNSPALRVEFEILNNPTLLRNGTKVTPLNRMIGGGLNS